MTDNILTQERIKQKEDRIAQIDHLLETEGKEWFSRFDCNSGTYKQVEDLKEERTQLRLELATIQKEDWGEEEERE